jgi:hypothetical protein
LSFSIYSLPLYSILQDLFTFYNIVVCVILLFLLYCNPSCCPLATLAITAALKTVLTEVPVLVKIDYSDRAGKVILGVDTSLQG